MELGEARHRLIRRQAFNLDASFLQAVEHLRIRAHPLVCARPHDKSLGELVGHVLQVDPGEFVTSRRHQFSTTRSGRTITSRVTSRPSTVTRPKR
jgi:hypothetical protein